MHSKDKTYLVNLWGLGDLLSTLLALKSLDNEKIEIISLIKEDILRDLMLSLKLHKDIKLKCLSYKVSALFFLFFLAFKKERLIFTSPLSGRSRSLARVISILSPNITLAQEEGNIYTINQDLIKQSFQR